MTASSSSAPVVPREFAVGDPAEEAYAWRGGQLPALHDSARKGDVLTVAAMLRDGVAAGMASEKGDTAPHRAAIGGHMLVMAKRLAAGAHWDASCASDGLRTLWRPLHSAARGGQLRSIRALHAAGADVHAMCTYGLAPVHSAGQNGVAEA